eukprot:comp20363_c0_seq1/m.25722 comp20363_c0_seq1/g.25722  ORF comp20363_c0_seq1/g.25722 comp20363_c0_seq1/m.25722 type:complete len:246 (-) comp20363_c0_seq1:136-873(-)
MAAASVLNQVDSMKRPLAVIQEQMEELYSSVLDVAEDMYKNEGDQDLLERLQATSIEWAKMSELLQAEMAVVDKLRHNLDLDAVNLDEAHQFYEEEYQKWVDRIDGSTFERSHFVTRMAEKTGSGTAQPMESEDEDADIQMGEVQKSYLCPITQKILENPMTNHCGHSYSGDAIMALIKTNGKRAKRVKCPFGGCRETVTTESLHVDKALEKEVRRHIRDQQVQTQLGPEDSNTLNVNYDDEDED